MAGQTMTAKSGGVIKRKAARPRRRRRLRRPEKERLSRRRAISGTRIFSMPTITGLEKATILASAISTAVLERSWLQASSQRNHWLERAARILAPNTGA